jgi:hypothetical protein
LRLRKFGEIRAKIFFQLFRLFEILIKILFSSHFAISAEIPNKFLQEFHLILRNINITYHRYIITASFKPIR